MHARITSLFVVVLATVAMWLLPADAQAAYNTLCMKHEADWMYDSSPQYQGSCSTAQDCPSGGGTMTTVSCTSGGQCRYDFGEDYGRVNSTNTSSLRNILVYVYESGGPLRYYGNVDNSGCTSNFYSVSEDFDIYLFPKYDDADTGVSFDVLTCDYSSPNCGGTATCVSQLHAVYGFDASIGSSFTVMVPSDHDLGAYAAASRTVDRFLGSIYQGGSNSYEVQVIDTNGCNNTLWDAPSSEAIVRLNRPGARSKFKVAHELGHAFVLDFLQIEEFDLVDCSYNGPDHTVEGQEYQSCADQEGFAHFVSAFVWNAVPNNANGVFVPKAESNPTLTVSQNIEGGGSKLILNHCSGAGCNGFGTEWDWGHMWWDYRTDSGTKPSNEDILWHFYLAENSYSWTHTSWHYQALYLAAHLNFGLGSRFSTDASNNGASIGG